MDGVARAWTYAAANVVLSNQSNFDCDQLDATVRPAGDDISCLACRRLWAERVWEATTTYSRVKVGPLCFPHDIGIYSCPRVDSNLFEWGKFYGRAEQVDIAASWM